MSTSQQEQFAARYAALQGHAHFAADLGDAGAIAVSICREAGATSVALGEMPEPFMQSFDEHARGAITEILRPPHASENLPARIDAAAAGITYAAFGIVESATIVELSTNDATRLVSSLPRIHIGVVHSAELIAALRDAAPRLRDFFNRHRGNCVASFISGPSRTGDIEMRLTLGVHGPETAHTILVGDGARHGG